MQETGQAKVDILRLETLAWTGPCAKTKGTGVCHVSPCDTWRFTMTHGETRKIVRPGIKSGEKGGHSRQAAGQGFALRLCLRPMSIQPFLQGFQEAVKRIGTPMRVISNLLEHFKWQGKNLSLLEDLSRFPQILHGSRDTHSMGPTKKLKSSCVSGN